MNGLARAVLVQVGCFVPVVLAVLVIYRKGRAWKARTKLPFRELRRRPPGESLRLKLETLDEKLSDHTGPLLLGPVVLGLVAFFYVSFFYVSIGFWFAVTATTVSTLWAAIFGWRLFEIIRERANYQLGFDGERFVGEELNRLAGAGFQVYHDVPFDGFNMDHVLVGAPGVFLVETKTRRKPIKDTGGGEYHVEFDGSCLRWPMGADTYGLQQAENNGRTLAQWLSGAVGDRVEVTPILALPGWMVDRKAPPRGGHVLNPREIVKLVDTGRVVLDENLMKRVCYQLDQRCKIEMQPTN